MSSYRDQVEGVKGYDEDQVTLVYTWIWLPLDRESQLP